MKYSAYSIRFSPLYFMFYRGKSNSVCTLYEYVVENSFCYTLRSGNNDQLCSVQDSSNDAILYGSRSESNFNLFVNGSGFGSRSGNMIGIRTRLIIYLSRGGVFIVTTKWDLSAKSYI